jgi:predicted ATP-dependent endonuclease of OLD family
MIRIEKIHIHEFRGIRELILDLKGQNFAACGPNGTGKSGIVDAIEFALSGNISRLSGAGTGGLSVKAHGPHVDSRNKPEVAFVTLDGKEGADSPHRQSSHHAQNYTRRQRCHHCLR